MGYINTSKIILPIFILIYNFAAELPNNILDFKYYDILYYQNILMKFQFNIVHCLRLDIVSPDNLISKIKTALKVMLNNKQILITAMNNIAINNIIECRHIPHGPIRNYSQFESVLSQFKICISEHLGYIKKINNFKMYMKDNINVLTDYLPFIYSMIAEIQKQINSVNHAIEFSELSKKNFKKLQIIKSELIQLLESHQRYANNIQYYNNDYKNNSCLNILNYIDFIKEIVDLVQSRIKNMNHILKNRKIYKMHMHLCDISFDKHQKHLNNLESKFLQIQKNILFRNFCDWLSLLKKINNNKIKNITHIRNMNTRNEISLLWAESIISDLRVINKFLTQMLPTN